MKISPDHTFLKSHQTTSCFKTVDNPFCNHLILANQHKYSEHSVYGTGISGFRKFTAIVLKACFMQKNPHFIKYRETARNLIATALERTNIGSCLLTTSIMTI